MEHKAVALKDRTKRFALRVIRLSRSLPASPEVRIIGNQVLRSATSVAANYRAACRARSRAEFLAKLGIVIEEADESALWLELLADAQVIPARLLSDLESEANQLVAICNASRTTAKSSFHSKINIQ